MSPIGANFELAGRIPPSALSSSSSRKRGRAAPLHIATWSLHNGINRHDHFLLRRSMLILQLMCTMVWVQCTVLAAQCWPVQAASSGMHARTTLCVPSSMYAYERATGCQADHSSCACPSAAYSGRPFILASRCTTARLDALMIMHDDAAAQTKIDAACSLQDHTM